MKETMGQIIKRLRKEREMTQDELASLLNISAPAISKWETDIGMPDISQIVPLSNIFGVSTDVLFGVEKTTENEDTINIIQQVYVKTKYGNVNSYISAYDDIINALKKYPTNLSLLNCCIGLGCSLALPENGWIYAADRADEITAETIRQANIVIAYSKNISEIMRAHEILVFMYSARGEYDKAISEANKYPTDTGFTMDSNLATVYEYMKNYDGVIHCLCRDIDCSLQQFEYNAARLGKAYINCGRYSDAIEVFEELFSVINSIFKDGCPPPYHDFDSGDCYILLAQAYIAIGNEDKALESVENSVMYYLNIVENYMEDSISWCSLRNSPLVKDSDISAYIMKSAIKEKLIEKLSDNAIQSLSDKKRFILLCDKIKDLEY